MTNSLTAQRPPSIGKYAFALALFAAFFYLAWRAIGLYPMVFADEWSYSSAARLLPFEKSIVPSWLYLGLFRLTSSCGPGFLDCARILNALLMVASAPFIFLVGRRVCGPVFAALLALAAVLSPASAFSAYFMPEAMYFFGFSVFTWVALEFRSLRPLNYGLVTGAVLGLLSVVKVHALFLLPAHLAFMLYLCWSGLGWGPSPKGTVPGSLGSATNTGGQFPAGAVPWLLAFLRMALAAVAAMLITKTAVGYLIAGEAGLSLLGNFYGAHATNTSGIDKLLAILPAAMVSLKGHALALVLLSSIPLAALALHVADPKARSQASPELRALQVFAVLMLGAALAMTVMFTGTIAAAGSLEGLRLHLRYYDFVFPLLLLIAAAPLLSERAPTPIARRALVALPLALVVAYAASVLKTEYSISFTDSPELGALTEHPTALRDHVFLALLGLAVWTLHRRIGTLLFVFVLVPLALVNADMRTRELYARSSTPGSYDKAGLLVRHLLEREDAGHLTVFGEGAGLLRALFHIDHPGAVFQELAPGAPFSGTELSPSQRWALVVGNHPMPPEMLPKVLVRTPEFALVRVAVDHSARMRVAFAKPLAGGALVAAEGLAAPEPWGAWSIGPKVSLTFAQPLPKKMTVLVKANAFPPNADQEFVMQVGEQRRPFHLSGSAQDRFFEFDTDGSTQVLQIHIPKPASPKSLGYGTDDRELGMALLTMEIGERK